MAHGMTAASAMRRPAAKPPPDTIVACLKDLSRKCAAIRAVGHELAGAAPVPHERAQQLGQRLTQLAGDIQQSTADALKKAYGGRVDDALNAAATDTAAVTPPQHMATTAPRSAFDSFGAFLYLLLESVCQETGAERGAIYTLRGRGGQELVGSVLFNHRNPPGVMRCNTEEQCLIGTCFASRIAVRSGCEGISDVDVLLPSGSEFNTPTQTALTRGTRTDTPQPPTNTILMPIHHTGLDCYGVLQLVNKHRGGRPFTDDDECMAYRAAQLLAGAFRAYPCVKGWDAHPFDPTALHRKWGQPRSTPTETDYFTMHGFDSGLPAPQMVLRDGVRGDAVAGANGTGGSGRERMRSTFGESHRGAGDAGGATAGGHGRSIPAGVAFFNQLRERPVQTCMSLREVYDYIEWLEQSWQAVVELNREYKQQTSVTTGMAKLQSTHFTKKYAKLKKENKLYQSMMSWRTERFVKAAGTAAASKAAGAGGGTTSPRAALGGTTSPTARAVRAFGRLSPRLNSPRAGGGGPGSSAFGLHVPKPPPAATASDARRTSEVSLGDGDLSTSEKDWRLGDMASMLDDETQLEYQFTLHNLWYDGSYTDLAGARGTVVKLHPGHLILRLAGRASLARGTEVKVPYTALKHRSASHSYTASFLRRQSLHGDGAIPSLLRSDREDPEVDRRPPQPAGAATARSSIPSPSADASPAPPSAQLRRTRIVNVAGGGGHSNGSLAGHAGFAPDAAREGDVDAGVDDTLHTPFSLLHSCAAARAPRSLSAVDQPD